MMANLCTFGAIYLEWPSQRPRGVLPYKNDGGARHDF